jgi:hypothetical protein
MLHMDQAVLAHDGTRDAHVPTVHDLLVCADRSHVGLQEIARRGEDSLAESDLGPLCEYAICLIRLRAGPPVAIGCSHPG